MSKDFELGQKVKFVRMMPDGGPVYGEGVVVAKLIGVSKRINYSIRDAEILAENGKPKAWNLEAEAIDGTDEQNEAYVKHHDKISDVVRQYDVDQKALADAANAKIDVMHDEFFGPRMDV